MHIFFHLQIFLFCFRRTCLKSPKINKMDMGASSDTDVSASAAGLRSPAPIRQMEWEKQALICRRVMECFLNENTPVFRTNMCH